MIIAIANQKGGVGKTTTVVNLGTSMALAGKKVLIIDIDPQGNATSGLGEKRPRNKNTIYQLLIEGKPVNDIIIATTIKYLDLIPADVALAGAEVELAGEMSREYRLKQALVNIRGRYDTILIDCPPSLGLLTINALTAADEIIIPIQCEYYALEGLSQLMNTIKLIKQNLNKGLTVRGILMTMFDARTNLAIQVIDEVKKHYKNKVFRTIIPRNIRLSEAPSFGKPVALYDPKCKGAEVYRDLAEEVMEIG